MTSGSLAGQPMTWTNPATKIRCYGKCQYPSAKRAEKQALRASQRTGDLIIAYECFDCGYWHIGHADKAQQIAREQKANKLKPNPQQIPGPNRPYHTLTAFCLACTIDHCCGKSHCKNRRRLYRRKLRQQVTASPLTSGHGSE